MDETNFLAPWYDKNKARGVGFAGVSNTDSVAR